MKKSLARMLAILLLVLGIAAPAAADQPSARIDYAMSYFAPSGGIIMHGGWGSPDWQTKDETWKLDSSGWSQISTTDSPSMSHHSMTYDSGRDVLVLCGADYSGSYPYSYQTWEFDGSNWTQGPDVPVGIDSDVEVAYDASRSVTVLYGISYYSSSGGSEVETWEYDGTSWTIMAPSQTPVACGDGALLQYDPVNKKVVLVGDDSGKGTETWTWDGTDWSQITGTQPENAMLGGMAFDSVRGEMVLITTEMETWTFNGSAWTQESPSASPTPSTNGFFSMAFDPVRQVAAFFSGESSGGVYPDKTWEWNGSTWSEFSAGSTPQSSYAALDASFNMTLPSIDLQGECYQADLTYYNNPSDPSNLYWMLDINSFKTASSCGSDAVDLDSTTLQMTIPNIDVQGTFFQVVLDYYDNPSDPSNLYWVLDLNSITQK